MLTALVSLLFPGSAVDISSGGSTDSSAAADRWRCSRPKSQRMPAYAVCLVEAAEGRDAVKTTYRMFGECAFTAPSVSRGSSSCTPARPQHTLVATKAQ
ncbi:hypothetical protein C3469_18660 [Mycobacterium kansasii]|nr:hypothetical protein C3479_22575 [Mycobacterium kansasii]POY25705.1 hypothetical protein C3469_18660 [Mycobacterium kansasii]